MSDTLIFAANAVLPIVFLMATGYVLKRIGFINDNFLAQGNKLVFRVLLPIMLFLSTYRIETLESIDFGFVLYSELALVGIFILGILLTIPYKDRPGTRGVLIQAMFRSNYALIGLSLASSLFGQEGMATASLLAGIFVPTLNFLAVITLTIFTDDREKGKADVKDILLKAAKNPLIIGALSGVLAVILRGFLVKAGITWRLSDITPLYKAMESLEKCATPVALLVLGGKFEFASVKTNLKPIIFGTILRTVLVPALTLSFAYFVMHMHNGAHFAAYVAAFGTPVAVSSAIMAGEMGCDDKLAGQLVVFTCIASIFTMFLTIAILRYVGIF
ncbi:MAG: AEC family transporter [Lachnospiraceae bacterium]|jgi:predicted permease|nr:AEC family transporter [Lachnospiraceae bacterium]